jgi:purine nucleosidase
MIEIFWDFTKRKLGWSGNESPMHDPLAIGVSMYPNIIKTVQCKVLVETIGQYTTGQTIVVPDNNGNVKVAYDVDRQRFIDLLMSRILIKG